MAKIESRLGAMGLALPPQLKPPSGVVLPFQFVRLVDDRALISGHGPQNADGSLAQPLGKVGREVSLEQGYAAARLVALSILGSLQRALGDADATARILFRLLREAQDRDCVCWDDLQRLLAPSSSRRKRKRSALPAPVDRDTTA